MWETPGLYMVLSLSSLQLLSCFILTTQDWREVHGVGAHGGRQGEQEVCRLF